MNTKLSQLGGWALCLQALLLISIGTEQSVAAGCRQCGRIICDCYGGASAPYQSSNESEFGEDIFSTSSDRVAGAILSDNPNSIGDFFRRGLVLGPAFDPAGAGNTIPLAGADRLLKVTEFNSPIPRDRLFFNYNHFHNALTAGTVANPTELDLNRYTVGGEMLLTNGLSSIECRIPFAGSLGADQMVGGINESTILSNVAFSYKSVIAQGTCSLLSGGLGVTLPTGNDSRYLHSDGVTLLRVDNEAFHLAPFLGLAYNPSDATFLQVFGQMNFDLNGNTYQSTGAVNGRGRVQDQALAFVDFSLGRWLYRNDGANYVTGLAAVCELHWTTTMSDPDDPLDGIVQFNSNRLSVLNLTGGLHTQIGPLSTLTVAAVAPLNEADRLFDSELAVQFNRRF